MKKLYPLLSVLFLIYWGCDDTKEEETTPTEVTLWGVVYSVEDTDSLNLSDNQITGEIPPEIGNLTNLTHLYLHSNSLTGSIPPEIGNLTNLTDLSLSFNSFMGSIPPEIGNLTNLTHLNLGFNSFIGEIPEYFCNSPFLYIIYNKFCPPYPSCIEDYVGTQDTSGCD